MSFDPNLPSIEAARSDEVRVGLTSVSICDTYHIVSVAQLRDALNALLDGLPAGANPDDIALSMDYWISLLQGRNRHGEMVNQIEFRVAEIQAGIKANFEARGGAS